MLADKFTRLAKLERYNISILYHFDLFQAGYLVKAAKKSARNWRRRYFVLDGNTLTYFEDHNKINAPKGNLLLVESSLEEEEVHGMPFSFRVTTPFESLLLAAKSEDDRSVWKAAINSAIQMAQRTLRGYMLRRVKGKSLLFGGTDRKFFVLLGNKLLMHPDHEQTTKILLTIELNAEANASFQDDKYKITITSGTENLIMQFEDRVRDEYPLWRDTITAIVARAQAIVACEEIALKEAVDSAAKAGIVFTRQGNGDVWKEVKLVLTESEVLVIDKSVAGSGPSRDRITERFLMHLDCSVFETVNSVLSNLE